jgi:hypothetical protein
VNDIKRGHDSFLKTVKYVLAQCNMWNIEYAKKIHKDNFAHALDEKVEDLARKHSE